MYMGVSNSNTTAKSDVRKRAMTDREIYLNRYAESKVVQNLGQAHSGAELNLTLHEGRLVVCKQMPLTDRTWKSLDKQTTFPALENVRPVEIIRRRALLDRVEVLMPLVRGVVGVDYVTSLSIDDVISFCHSLHLLLSRLRNNATPSDSHHHMIQKKIEELYSHHSIGKSYRKLLNHLSLEIQNIASIPIGPCHGDLTLGNMIFVKSTKAIHLIDFLDTYLESPLIDLAKLEQDLVFGWSSRYENHEVRLRAKILGAHVFEGLRILDPQDERLFNVFRILNTLRILPYCKDAVTEKWVHYVISQQENVL